MNLSSRTRVGIRRLAQATRSALPHETTRLPRWAWFRLKRALRLPTRGDRRFLLEEFGHKLDEGRIGKEVRITIGGRDDGAGSQALARMSAIALADKYGLTYVHTPFRGMQVAEGPGVDIFAANEEWAATWERIFNLGHGEISAKQCALPRLEVDDFMADRRLWTSRCLLSAGYFSMILDRMPEAYVPVIPRLREKFFLSGPPEPHVGVIEVCAHLRRGQDVTRDNPETAYRYVVNDVMAKSIRTTQSVLKELGLKSRVRLFSQGDEKDFATLRDLDIDLCLNTPAIPTFRAFVEADVFIMTKSSFSYAAGILNGGVTLYDRFARSPLPGWIERDGDGGFDPEHLRAKLVAHRAH
jgi:hypothetical protein